jgi:hypothetical protein
MRIRTSVLAGLACAAVLVACGGGGGSSSGESSGLPPGHAGVKVIEGWVNSLRRGNVQRAAGYFALPSIVQNGTAPVVLHTRPEAIAFNQALPCGAQLLRAHPAGRFINATFRLTDRPGGGCGSGVGLLARTAFVIRGGKIVQWRRLPNPPGQEPAPSGPVV